jgi:hypothetical protein
MTLISPAISKSVASLHCTSLHSPILIIYHMPPSCHYSICLLTPSYKLKVKSFFFFLNIEMKRKENRKIKKDDPKQNNKENS